MIITIHLDQIRGRAGWMWGFWAGWLGVLILACMSNPDGAPKMRDSQMRELEVRELEAKVRLAELRQAGRAESD